MDVKSVRELQNILQSYGVTFSGQKKCDLISLCNLAVEVGLTVDPDGLVEDREEVLLGKLTTHDGLLLTNPQLLSGSKDLHELPPLSVFDLYNYLLGFADYDHSSLREIHKMEGYGLFQDGFVLDLEVVKFDSTPAYVAVKCKVKPRTKDSDSATALSYYSGWIVFTSHLSGSGPASSVLSAYCTCKGGLVNSLSWQNVINKHL